MMKTSRFRFGLRFLLLLPVLVAACYGGWTLHDYQLQRQYRRQEADALERRTALVRDLRKWEQELMRERAVSTTRLRQVIEQVEHQQRIDAFQSQLNAPINSRMFPEGGFQ